MKYFKPQVELLTGQIIKNMKTLGTGYATAITLARKLLEKLLGERVLVRSQLPIQLEDALPKPAIAVVMPDVLRYADSHPIASEIYLLIEIADNTLVEDCEIQGKKYARSKIEEYWVLDINGRQLYVFREPSDDGYHSQLILSEDSTVAILALSNCSFAVRQMLRP
ncbi:MAG: Uma2 family endonuclease [Oscillatoriaceae cyanobacterium Prado104]|jgi:Uma2 family endonuclease|nr:Uma2 family endonuclease [Oscillatoriaceae cyanobacterium Prado104]